MWTMGNNANEKGPHNPRGPQMASELYWRQFVQGIGVSTS